MATNRIEVLQQMLQQDSRNSFARYGLAMELAKSGDWTSAVTEFKSVIASDSAYVAAYYHCGQTLEKLGNLDEARSIYEHGMEACDQKGDGHTRGEIEAALSLLPI